MKLRTAGLSDIGRVRRENEDRVLLNENLGIFGVADGVGGLPGGGEAAQQAVDELTYAFSETSPETDPDLTAIVHRVNESVAALGRKMSPALGIGTTLSFGMFRNGQLRIAHVGDSRAYGWRAGEMVRLTEDHSVENEARQRRARGEVVYYNEMHRNALTRCIGQPTPPDVDLLVRELKAGDRYFFCTDGVNRLVPDRDLLDILGHPGTPAVVLDEIISLAVGRGGPDNATGVVIYVDEA
jgi:protein phosphatase